VKKYTVSWTLSAKNDLETIIEYIAKDSIEMALKKYVEIKERAKKLTLFPEQGRIIPELLQNNIVKYKEIIISPWRIMYKIEKNTVYVMAIIDSRRNIVTTTIKIKWNITIRCSSPDYCHAFCMRNKTRQFSLASLGAARLLSSVLYPSSGVRRI
jgi:toxin ParE1/3/4